VSSDPLVTYLGIDLTSSPRRASAYAVLHDDGALADVGPAREDAALLALIERWRPRVVAVDAPLSLPRGLCCLEEACRCRPAAPDGLKAAERELFRRGISLYATTKRSIIKAMVYRATDLRRVLEEHGVAALEVYPYAAKVCLWGKGIPRKTTPAGRQWLREKLADLVPGLADHRGRPGHDQLDAIVAAYTAYLYGHGLAEGVGDPEEGLIYLPLSSARGGMSRGQRSFQGRSCS
jgi:predicted nuclease with RNAse H fold